MKAKRNDRNSKELIELVLTLLAVIAGSVAAIGGFLSASYEKQRVDLERKPAIFLSCEPEFRILDLAEGTKPATNAALLTRGGARWIHLVSDRHENTPQPFAGCTLTNYGQLPVFNIRMRIALQRNSGYDAAQITRTSLDIPGVSPAASYSFALINGTSERIMFAFEPALTLMRADTGVQSAVPLFLSAELVELERRAQDPELQKSAAAPRREVDDAEIVRIKDFRFGPQVLHARTNEAVTFENEDPEPHTVTATGNTFDSRSIDFGAAWTHRFTRPGTYWYICSFHPYMRGRIVVSAAAAKRPRTTARTYGAIPRLDGSFARRRLGPGSQFKSTD
jgi:plastocyanin